MNEDIYVVGTNPYMNQTVVHPVGLTALIILGLFVLGLPRRWVVVPIIIMACFIPSAQRVVIMGLDFNFLRILVCFGFLRIYSRHENKFFQFHQLDSIIFLWVLSSMVIYLLRQATFSAFVNRLGFAFDAIGMYFLFRCLIRRVEDIETVIRSLIGISVIVAIVFLIELITARNLFSVFGGVPAITDIRQGRLRCQGAYSHPILAGCFWAALMPLIASFWWKSKKARLGACIGLAAPLVIVFCCASSTPVMGILAAMLGGIMFYFRFYLRWIRWGAVTVLATLHVAMKAPVWHLISRISAVGGSTGWHRFNLIDQAIIHFDQWWLLGCYGTVVAQWGVHAGDVTNQYIFEGVQGGLITLCLFLILHIIAFRDVGRLWRNYRNNTFYLAVSWALGVSLFVHCVNFMGVTYFGQINMIWYLLLGTIGSMAYATPRLQQRIVRRSVSPVKTGVYQHNS